MFTNASKYIKDFEKNSKDNPLHESLLTYLKINPVRSKRDVRYLVEYMYKNHMLEDNMCYIYIQFLFNGNVFQKAFEQLVKELDEERIKSNNQAKKNNKGTNNGKAASKEEYIKSLCDDEEKDELESFLSATHYVNWKHVRNGKKVYIFEPELDYYMINPLQIKPGNVPLLNISNLEKFYNWLPPVRFRIDRKFNISHFEFQAFFKAIDLCDQLRKALKDPIFKNKLWKIHKTTHTLDWNHVITTKTSYIIQPVVCGLTIEGIRLSRKNRPSNIAQLVKKYPGLPDVTFRITQDFQVTGLNVSLVDEIIDFCVAKDQQIWEEEQKRMAKEQEERKRIQEENRRKKLQETYERLRKKGVDMTVFKETFTLKWSEVRFYNRYFMFEPQLGNRIGKNRITPLRVDDYRCKTSFNYILSYFQDRLPAITYKITTEFGIELNSKPLFEAALTYLTKEQARIDAGISVMSSAGRITLVTKRSFESALSKAAAMKPEDFKRYKSKFIDFLVEKQMDEYKVVPVSENVSHSRSSYDEASFIFTAKSWDGRIFIIIENVNPDRSTLLFKVERDMYMTALHTIFDYIQSDVINKRSAIRDGDIDFGNIGILAYWTFNHDSYIDWKYRLMGYLD